MTKYGFKVVMPDLDELTKAGFGKVAHIPAIFDSEPGYARLPSRFLIDRALGVWDPQGRGAKPNPRLPSRRTIRNLADWLVNALEWAEERGVDLVHADYSADLIGRYQDEMLKGIWSGTGNPLSGRTIDVRVDAVIQYQMWCADKGHRGQFSLPTVTRTHSSASFRQSHGHEARPVQARRGKVRESKRDLSFPSEAEISVWRSCIYQRPVIGATEGLMVDHVLTTAIRREELACWRIDTLPLDPQEWNIINPMQPLEEQQVAVVINRGTKGREYYIDEFGDKVGPKDTILVPLTLARDIHNYRNGARLIALKVATKNIRNPSRARKIVDESVHLYLNPTTGKRYTGAQIYEFWTRPGKPKHWSPHRGRDWWACQYLLRSMRHHANLIGQLAKADISNSADTLIKALRDTAQTVIQLEIRPQLRHSSSATTEIYLEWLFNQLRLPLNVLQILHEQPGSDP